MRAITETGMTLKQISESTGIRLSTIKRRYYNGDRGDFLRRSTNYRFCTTETHRKAWRLLANIKNKCYNEFCEGYSQAGAKGCVICPEWEDKHTFYRWLEGQKYDGSQWLIRIDADGDFDPDNCVLAPKEQARKMIVHNRHMCKEDKNVNV